MSPSLAPGCCVAAFALAGLACTPHEARDTAKPDEPAPTLQALVDEGFGEFVAFFDKHGSFFFHARAVGGPLHVYLYASGEALDAFPWGGTDCGDGGSFSGSGAFGGAGSAVDATLFAPQEDGLLADTGDGHAWTQWRGTRGSMSWQVRYDGDCRAWAEAHVEDVLFEDGEGAAPSLTLAVLDIPPQRVGTGTIE